MNAVVCPDADELAALLASEAGDFTDYADHLETCIRCQQTLAELDDWPEAMRCLVRIPARAPGPPGATAPALERIMVLLKSELPHGPPSADPPWEEDLPPSLLRPANRPGLLGFLGEYEVLEVIGRGGMGVVFKAFEPTLQRLVAVKVMAGAGSGTARRRFKREAQAAAAVCHDHIVAVHGIHEAEGLPYLVMQFVPGESLQARLDRTGPLEVMEAVRIGLQTAAGLAAAHAQGLIHRDVKPANLLLENGLSRVKITDFGLARMADDAALTQPGMVAGTPEYMAPEQARGEAVDHRVDLFSLGSVLYAVCTGVPPFRASTAVAVLRKVSDSEPTPIRSLNPDVPAWLETLIGRLMAKDPANRFQSAAEVAALLEGYLAHLRQPSAVLAPELPVPLAVEGPESPESWTEVVKRLPQQLWLWTAGMAAILGLLFFQIDQPTPPSGGLRDQFVHDFRGRPLPENMTLFGHGADGYIKGEAEGLRINLPRSRSDHSPVGLSLPLAIEGDFEITTSFEILQAEAPHPGKPAYGTGVLMSVNEAARIGRLVRVGGKQVVSWDRWGMVDGKRKFLDGASPGKGGAGRLRLKRTNSILYFLWSPELAGENFEKIHECEFGTDEINLLRLETNSNVGRIAGRLDVRFLDLTVRSALKEAAPAVDLEKGRSTRSQGWLLAAGMVGAAILLFLALGLILRWRRRRVPDEHTTNRTAPAARQREPVDDLLFVSVCCSRCGKALKCKPELAGKKVKCPHCGMPVKVPEGG